MGLDVSRPKEARRAQVDNQTPNGTKKSNVPGNRILHIFFC